MRKFSILPVAAFALAGIAPMSSADVDVDRLHHAEPGQFGFSVGAEYSSGDYGSYADTEIWYFPLSVRYQTDRWLLRLTVPYLAVSGPGDVLIIGGGGMGSHSFLTSLTGTGGMGGVGGMGGTISTTGSRTESGIGDIIAAASYALQTGDRHRPAIDLTGKVYLGTADETKGLGTGENSYAAQLDFDQGFGVATLYGAVGYLVTGDPPGIEYEDVLYGALGLERDFGRNTLGGRFDAQQATAPGGDAYATLSGYFSTRWHEARWFTTYLSLGLADGAPDFGVGVTFTWYP